MDFAFGNSSCKPATQQTLSTPFGVQTSINRASFGLMRPGDEISAGLSRLLQEQRKPAPARPAKFLLCWCTAFLLPCSFQLRSGESLASELNGMNVDFSSISRIDGNLKPFVETHFVVKFLNQVGFKSSFLAAQLLFLTELRRKPNFLILCRTKLLGTFQI